MADDVRIDYVFKGVRRAIVRLSGLSDGTGESLVKKVDLTDLTMVDGLSPDSVCIEEVEYAIQGYSSVELFWDRAPTAISALRLAVGVGELEYEGGLQDPNRGQDGTGDILLTTNGETADATYEILLHLRLKRY